MSKTESLNSSEPSVSKAVDYAINGCHPLAIAYAVRVLDSCTSSGVCPECCEGEPKIGLSRAQQEAAGRWSQLAASAPVIHRPIEDEIAIIAGRLCAPLFHSPHKSRDGHFYGSHPGEQSTRLHLCTGLF
eukprot:3670678-Rhodomonas_salina.2